MDTNSIRQRIASSGWKLREIPIVKTDRDSGHQTIGSWKLIANDGIRSVEVGGSNIDEAMKKCGQVLGLVGGNS